MRVSCIQETLAKSLSVVSHAVATRATLPVLGNICLTTDQGRLRLSATNLEVGIACWIGARVEEDGAATVPARAFIDLVGAMPQDRIDLALGASSQTIQFKCGRFQNNLRGADPAEFPVFPCLDGASAIRLDAGLLRAAITQVVFAAASDDKRPILTGVLARIHNDPQSVQGRITFAAADGFRLAVRTIPLLEPAAVPASAIIPARALGLLARLGGDQQNPAAFHITASKAHGVFRLDHLDLVAQLLDGSFPDYEQIIPKAWQTRVVAQAADLVKACKAASVFARESAHTARVTVMPEGESGPARVTLQAVSAETGDNTGHVDATVEGPGVQIAVNVNYLMAAVSAADTPYVALELMTPASPVLIRPAGEDSGYVCVIMPIDPTKS